MHLGLTAILEFYRTHTCDDALVLGTVVATEGSTYRKPGAMILIAADGSYCGLISGGCLEADLASHAKAVFADGVTRDVSYDLRISRYCGTVATMGCDGVIHLLLQRLDASDGFGFLQTLEQAWKAKSSGLLSLVTSSNSPSNPSGSFALHCGTDFVIGDPGLLTSIHSPEGSTFSRGHDMSRQFWQDTMEMTDGSVKVLLIPIMPPPAILICGAGPDALPVARLAVEMGWECTIVDHRSGFARADRFPSACYVIELQANELESKVSLDHIDATVVMTHHLEHDRNYLKQVIAAKVSYIGLLGPGARKDRLLSDIDAKATHVHGPVGLDIGAEMPDSIGLAIIAEIHTFLNRRDGRTLTQT